MASSRKTAQTEADDALQQITFSINGKSYTVGSNVPPSASLLQFIREFARLPGTKGLCYEGGCGICTVVATTFDPETGGQKTFSLKSCQTLVYSCAGWAVETIEHLGNRYKGYHPLQKALTSFYGTQCGYCSPGFVMTMYGELKSTGELSTKQVERALDGNICRCTGYRPILDAFKSMAKDAPKELKSQLIDIEDSFEAVCPTSGEVCKEKCSSDECSTGKSFLQVHSPKSELEITLTDIRWYRPVSISGIYKIMQKTTADMPLRFVVGNTGEGVYKNEGRSYSVFIDTTGVSDLYSVGIGVPLTIGANISLHRCIAVFRKMAKEYIGYRHLEEVAKHWENVANVGVRNVASWSGNLMLKHFHPEFPSDIFITLAAIDASVLVGHSANSSTSEVTVEELMALDMSKSFILSITIPQQDQKTIVRSYKIAPRAVNAHAYVNATFKFKTDFQDGFKLLSKPTLIFGGIAPSFVHASATENFLDGRRLAVEGTITEAVKRLVGELIPDSRPSDASPEYRKTLAEALFYKAVLGIMEDQVSPEFRSGGSVLERPISSGQQNFDPNKDSWPIGQAVPKLESDIQVAGEAEYIDDMDPVAGEVYGAFVQSTVGRGKVKNIDPSDALELPGVIAFISAKDIPGTNSFIREAGAHQEPIFVDTDVSYHGQSIGLIVAERRDLAMKATRLVKVEYSDVKKPILTIKEALKNTTNNFDIDDKKKFADSKHMIEGELEQGSQFHMTMEALIARVIPVEDGYDVFCSSQWPTETQNTVAHALGISNNSVNVTVKRLGGGYGGKISRQNIVGCAAAVAANKLQLPVRIALDLKTNMTLVGWREPYLSKYRVGFDDEGLLKMVKVQLISDAGFVSNVATASYAARWVPNVYAGDKWDFSSKIVNTNTASNTYCRTPGSTEAIATMENIIEHVASYLKKDPVEIREKNFVNKHKDSSPRAFGPRGENLVQTKLFPELKIQARYDDRRKEIQLFNKENRWRKRGLTMVPLFYGLSYPPPMRYNTQVVIYADDGSIVISHGGIEMGQGLNTKVAQVAAKILNAPFNYVKVKPTNVVVGANSAVTGGSYGSDLVAHGVQQCCEKLRVRMDVVAERMKKHTSKDPTWSELVEKCLSSDVDLSERYWTAAKEHPKPYDIFATVCMEVEVDVLTGQFMMLRTDLIEDCGRSMSPYIDIGQIEGSLIMGLGYYTSEIVKYDPETGEKLSNGTWEYKVPTALDIPTDLRITLLPKGDNQFGVVRSKATGEPPLCLSYCVVTALRDAIKAARSDAGDTEWFDMPTPLTVERVQRLCKVDPSQFLLTKKTEQRLSVDELNDFHVVERDEVPKLDEASCVLN